MKFYVESSWRNPSQPIVVGFLRDLGHEVYDFRHPKQGDNGFQWSQIDPNWELWTSEQFIRGLDDSAANRGFTLDYDAMKWADASVLVMPCGRSAHLELGWMLGRGKPSCIFLSNGEPELMYKMADALVYNFKGLGNWVESL